MPNKVSKTWFVCRRDRNDNWSLYAEVNISKQQAYHEMKRQAEKDNKGYSWFVFELVSAVTTVVTTEEAEIVEPEFGPQINPNLLPLEDPEF